jgi:hypothetical protein
LFAEKEKGIRIKKKKIRFGFPAVTAGYCNRPEPSDLNQWLRSINYVKYGCNLDHFI